MKALATANAYVRNPANRHFVAVTMAHSFKLDKVEYGEKASDVAIGRYVLRKPYPSPEGIRNLIDLGKDEFPFLTKADLRTFIEPRWVRELDQVGFFDKLSGR